MTEFLVIAVGFSFIGFLISMGWTGRNYKEARECAACGTGMLDLKTQGYYKGTKRPIKESIWDDEDLDRKCPVCGLYFIEGFIDLKEQYWFNHFYSKTLKPKSTGYVYYKEIKQCI